MNDWNGALNLGSHEDGDPVRCYGDAVSSNTWVVTAALLGGGATGYAPPSLAAPSLLRAEITRCV
jgi:hypothetical protein